MGKRRAEGEPIIIKKYANRRLYDTSQSCYVTLDDLSEMVREGHDFVVQDAKSKEDITHSVLTQIIAEQEGNGPNMLPTEFLRKIIGFYGGQMGELVPNYLEHTLDMFIKNQESLQEKVSSQMGSVPNMFNPAKAMEEMGRKNMQMFESTMKMFTPFGTGLYASNESDAKEVKKRELEEAISELKKELDEIA